MPRGWGSGEPNLPWGSAGAAALVLQGERWEGDTRVGPCPLLMQPHPWQELGWTKSLPWGDFPQLPWAVLSLLVLENGTASSALPGTGRQGKDNLESCLCPGHLALSPSCT